MKIVAAKPRSTDRAPIGLISDPAVRVRADHEADWAALALDDRGMIRDCNLAGEALFGYDSGELLARHISLLLPQLVDTELLQDGQPNPRLRFLCRIGHHFQAQSKDGGRFSSEIFLNILDSGDAGRLSLIVRPPADAAR